MTNELPFIEVRLGGGACLHVGAGLSIHNKVFVAEIENQFEKRGYTVSTAIPTIFKSSLLSRLIKETAAGWLARKCKISKKRAGVVISQINSRELTPDGELSRYAGTPKGLLAIAAAVMSKPQVMLYGTDGLDASGVLEIHAFVNACREDLGLFALHISTPCIRGDGTPAERMCPARCACFEIQANRPREK